MHPDRGLADEAGDVGRDALALHKLEIFAEAGPFDAVFDVALTLGLIGLHRRVPGAHRLPFAHHLQRHALADVALPPPVRDQALIRPTQHVDEAGRHGEAGGVNHLSCGASTAPDADDPLAPNGNISNIRRTAAAVVDRAAAQYDVGSGGCRHRRAG
jgi:hypothetical protein